MLNSIISNPITLPELLACLLCAMVLGVFTSLVFLYKSRHSAGFLLTLAMLPMAVAVVILLVNGNIGTGVAVAGALHLCGSVVSLEQQRKLLQFLYQWHLDLH